MNLTLITILCFGLTNAFIATSMGYTSARIEPRQKLMRWQHRSRPQLSRAITGVITFEQLAKMLKQAQQTSSRRKYQKMVLFKKMQATVASYDN